MIDLSSNSPEEDFNDSSFEESTSENKSLEENSPRDDDNDNLDNEEIGNSTSVQNRGDGNTTAINSEIGGIINNIITIGLDEILLKSLKPGPTDYPNVDPSLNREYKNILAHIKNKLRDKEFDKAFEFCQKAEELAPAEPTTWEYFALTEFLREINKKEKRKRKPVREIIKSVKNHLEKGKDHGLSEAKYEEITSDIANQLFKLQKARINSIASSSKDFHGGEIWGGTELRACLFFLTSYEQCFILDQEVKFLEEYVAELSKPYKWIVKTRQGSLVNRPVYGDFSAVEKRENLLTKLRSLNSSYQPTEIKEERITILPDPIKIISID